MNKDALWDAAMKAVDDFRAANSDGVVSVNEVFRLTIGLLSRLYNLGATLPRDELREVCLRAVELLDQRVIRPLNLPGPDVVIDPIVTQIVNALAAEAVDYLFEAFDRVRVEAIAHA